MTRISIQGHTFDLSPDALVIWLTGLMVDPPHIMEGIFWAQSCGLRGNSYNSYLNQIDEIIKILRENLSIIDDPRILEIITSFLTFFEDYISAARKIIEWQNTQIPKKTRDAHHKFVRGHGPMKPPWYDNEEYITLMHKSSSIFKHFLLTLSQTIPIIQNMFSPLPESNELDRTIKLISEYQLLLDVGYEEWIKKKAIECGYEND